MGARLRALAADRRGLSALEYGLFGALITAVLVTALSALAALVQPLYPLIASGLTP